MSEQVRCLCAFEPLDEEAMRNLQDDFFVLMDNHKHLEPPALTHYLYVLLARLAFVVSEDPNYDRHLIRIFSMALDHVAEEFKDTDIKTGKKKRKKNADR